MFRSVMYGIAAAQEIYPAENFSQPRELTHPDSFARKEPSFGLIRKPHDPTLTYP